MTMQRLKTSALALALLLAAGCAKPPQKNTGVTPSPPANAPPAAADGSGYYLDDGPPAEHSIALADIPDAVVRLEKINPAHNRPYTVLDKRYVPFQQLRAYKKHGVASWYGKRYHNRKTASGEIYDMFKMTAAHPILPIPSYVRVTRADSGESVIVRINDRGPFLQGREIDLSYAAAAKLGIVNAGTGDVIVEAVLPPQSNAGAADATDRIKDIQPLNDQVYIQLAAFAQAAAAQRLAQKLQLQLPEIFSGKITVHQKAGGLYAVQVGPYSSHEQATLADDQLCRQHQHCGFLTKRYGS